MFRIICIDALSIGINKKREWVKKREEMVGDQEDEQRLGCDVMPWLPEIVGKLKKSPLKQSDENKR
jgi:hypothetical protein